MNAYILSSSLYKYDELMEVTFERDKWIIKDGGTQTKGDEQISSGNGKTPLSFTKQYQPRSLHSIELQYVQLQTRVCGLRWSTKQQKPKWLSHGKSCMTSPIMIYDLHNE